MVTNSDAAVPRRYQRTRLPAGKRTPDQCPPPGAVYVGRRGPFGNPWIIQKMPGVRKWEVRHLTEASVACRYDSLKAAQHAAVVLYRKHLREHPDLVNQIRRELADRSVTCWCKVADSCHGDVTLAVAAGEAA